MKSLIKAFLVAVAVTLLVATPVLAYVYRAQYSVSNNTTTSYAMLPVIGDANNDWMAANGFMTASANDTRIETFAGAIKPHLVVDNMTLTAIPVPANSVTNLYYTTGNSELSAFDILCGYSGNITASDAANIELGDNFTCEVDGWIDTTAETDKEIIDKPEALKVYVSSSDSGNITAGVFQWTSPTGFGDPAGVWINEANAYDENVATWAQRTSVPFTSWTDFLELNHTHIECDRVRYYCGGSTADIDQIDVDVYYDGGWQDLYQGAFTQAAWETKEIGDTVSCNSTRIRLYNSNGGVSPDAYVYEVDFGAYLPSISATGVASGEHTCNVTARSFVWAPGDKLHFDGTNASNVNAGNIYSENTSLWVSFWFQLDNDFTPAAPAAIQRIWGKNTGAETDYITMWLNDGTGQIVFRLKVGNVVKFTILSTQTSWNGGQWYHILGSISAANGVRFRVDGGAAQTGPDNTALFNGGNFIIGDRDDPGAGTGFEGHIANFCVGTDDLSVAEELALYQNTFPGDETDLWYIDEGTGTNIISYGSLANAGTADTNTTWVHTTTRPCKFAITIDDTAEDGFARPTAVPDNANDWSLLQGNSVPYADYIRFTIDGVDELYYAPTSYIVGTTLPDRQGADNDGTFSWGTNPVDVTVTLGSMVSSGQPALGVTEEEVITDMLPTVEVTDWFVAPDVSGTLLTNPLRPLVTLLSDNSTLSERQVWILYGTALLLFITIGTAKLARGHYGIAGIVCGAGIVGLVALTVYPLWALVFTVLAIMSGLVAERSPSL